MGAGQQKEALEEFRRPIQQGDVQGVRQFLRKVAIAKSPNTPGSRRDSTNFLKGLDINSEVFQGATPLQLAAMCRQAEIIRVMLDDTAADPSLPRILIDALDSNKRTALHCAASAPPAMAPASAQCVADLLHRKANPCIASADGLTPLDIARRAGCQTCVRTIEDNVKLWAGWVDHDEKGFLGLPNWQPRWLVVLRDRYANTGNKYSGPVRLSCYQCATMLQLPAYCYNVTCTKCGADVGVTPSLQLALYASDTSAENLVLPDSAMPVMTVQVPTLPSLIQAKPLEDASWQGTLQAVWKGNIRRALQNTPGGEREFGLTVKITGNGRVVQEHSLRVSTEVDRNTLLSIFQNPVGAAFQAMSQAMAPAAPAAPAAAPAAAAAPTPPFQVPPPSQAAASSSSAAPAASAPHAPPFTMPPSPRKGEAPAAGGYPETAASTGASSSSAPAYPPAAPSAELMAQQALLFQPSAEQALSAQPPPPPTPAPTRAPIPMPEKPATNQAATGNEREDDICVVCMERQSDCAVVPCGHLCGCEGCLNEIKNSASPQCPMCRGPVTSLIRIFRN